MLRWPLRLDCYDDSHGNNFTPLIESGGYNYSTGQMRAEDIGESAPNGHSILAVNWYFRQSSQDPNYRNIDNVRWTFEVAVGENFVAHGANIYPFVVVADYVPEFYGESHQPPSSGRYWLRSKPLTPGSFSNFAQTSFNVPSSSGWVGTFSRAGAVVNMPASPDLRCIEVIGIGFQDYSHPPEGDFAVRLIEIG